MFFIVEHQNWLRVGFSLSGLAIFMGLGLLFPFRKAALLKSPARWLTNLCLTFGNAIVVRIIAPLSLVEIAAHSSFDSWAIWQGFQNPVIHMFFGLVLLDLVLYWQHRLTHKIPLLWRLHRVHHSDTEFDATLAGRFHFFEIVFSFVVKGFFVITFNLNAATIIVFEIILNFSALFNHSNFKLPDSIEKIVRWLVITPDLHRIHHSTLGNEMNSNFGFSVSCWDRIFNSFTSNPTQPPQTMPIGLDHLREPNEQRLWSLIKQPFLKNH